MKHIVSISESQKIFMAEEILDEPIESIRQTFQDYIEEEVLYDYRDLLYSYIEREKYLLDSKRRISDLATDEYSESLSTFQKKQKLSRAKDISKQIAEKEIFRIKSNIQFMTINSQLETLMDVVCHTNFDWMDELKHNNKTSALTEEEELSISQKKSKTFGKRTLGSISQLKLKSQSIHISPDSDILDILEAQEKMIEQKKNNRQKIKSQIIHNAEDDNEDF